MQHNLLEGFEKQTAELLKIDLKVVEKVINHKWKTLFDSLYVNTEVEDSGLCKLKIRPKKVQQEIKNLNNMLLGYNRQLEKEEDLKKIETLKRKINTAETDIAYLKTKINEF